jgi:beta-glucosidase
MTGFSMSATERRAIPAALAACVLAGAACQAADPAATAAARDARASQGDQDVDVRVRELLAELSLDEKLQLVHGTGRPDRNSGYAGKVAGIPRLGIPDLVLADGPNGVGSASKNVTAYAAAISAAAACDPQLMERYGQAVGQEQAGKGHNVALAPTLNIMRVPQWGRSFETLSEDPYLTAELAKSYIRGLQSQGIIATAKHFAANNQESDRTVVSAAVDERTLREIYLPGFEAAVNAGVLSIMCAYNRVNGDHACENKALLDIPREDWGFAGFVMSDWAATHSTEKQALAGLDMEMPFGPMPDRPEHYGSRLKDAVVSNRVPLARLDDMVARILRSMIKAGLMDHPPKGDPSAVVSTPEHQDLAAAIAAQGAVLLKNDRDLLPFMPERVRSIAVIGATAHAAPIYTGRGSASVVPSRTITPLDGIRGRAGDGIKVSYAAGTPGAGALPDIDVEHFRTAAGEKGLTASYYASSDFSGTPLISRVEQKVNFIDRDRPGEDAGDVTANPKAGSGEPPVQGRRWSARWEGTLTPPASGPNRFSLGVRGVARLYVDGKLVLSNDGRGGSGTARAIVDLESGKPVAVRVEYVADLPAGRRPTLRLGWYPAKSDMLQEAVSAAKAADVAVVFVNDIRGEGSDAATLALPADQDQLIEAVAAANPRTAVVLETGGAVLMPWLGRVAGVVEAWYPGQENGRAIAAILFGDVNPSGKLPITFPRADSQTPVADPKRWPGIRHVARYDEGLLVGYRWYDARDEEPLFPFGYGLSYTSFRISGLAVAPPGGQRTRHLTAQVANTGTRRGAEVVQLYLGFPDSAGEPPRQLKGFRKVELDPGASATVHFELQARDFASWNEAQKRWTDHAGDYRVMVGSSSRSIQASTTLTAPSQPLPANR